MHACVWSMHAHVPGAVKTCVAQACKRAAVAQDARTRVPRSYSLAQPLCLPSHSRLTWCTRPPHLVPASPGALPHLVHAPGRGIPQRHLVVARRHVNERPTACAAAAHAAAAHARQRCQRFVGQAQAGRRGQGGRHGVDAGPAAEEGRGRGECGGMSARTHTHALVVCLCV